MASTPRTALALSAGASFCAAMVWAALAWRSPTSTFHFAPFVAVVVGPYVVRTKAAPERLGSAAIVAAASGIVVAGVSALLVGADRLRGPTFWSDSGAFAEALVFTAFGGLIGFALLGAARSTHTSD